MQVTTYISSHKFNHVINVQAVPEYDCQYFCPSTTSVFIKSALQAEMLQLHLIQRYTDQEKNQGQLKVTTEPEGCERLPIHFQP